MDLTSILKTLSLTLFVFTASTFPEAFAFCDFFCELPNRGGSQGATLGNNLVSFALIAGVGVLGYRIFRGRKKSKKDIKSKI